MRKVNTYKNKNKNKRSNKNKTQRTQRKQRKQKTRGGRAVDAGSYGCVFDPALKCIDKSIPYKENYISKLMYKRDAKNEN